jgi:hypothetical protein
MTGSDEAHARDPLSDTIRMVDDWDRDATEKAARFQEMSQRVADIDITESVGPVSVTVGNNGIPTDITMAEAVRGMPPQEIAAAVMAAMRKAQSRYPARLAEILAETVGEDDLAGQHIVAVAERNFPPPQEDDGDEGALRFSELDDQPPQRDEQPPRREEQPPRRRAPRPPRGGDDDEGFDNGTIYGA